MLLAVDYHPAEWILQSFLNHELQMIRLLLQKNFPSPCKSICLETRTNPLYQKQLMRHPLYHHPIEKYLYLLETPWMLYSILEKVQQKPAMAA